MGVLYRIVLFFMGVLFPSRVLNYPVYDLSCMKSFTHAKAHIPDNSELCTYCWVVHILYYLRMQNWNCFILSTITFTENLWQTKTLVSFNREKIKRIVSLIENCRNSRSSTFQESDLKTHTCHRVLWILIFQPPLGKKAKQFCKSLFQSLLSSPIFYLKIDDLWVMAALHIRRPSNINNVS